MHQLLKILFLCTLFLAPLPVLGSPLDIDGNGEEDALTDGLLLLRFSLGFRGETLVNEAIGTGASRTTSTEIEEYITSQITSFDLDGDGATRALTDGILVLRYLFDFTGDTLTSGAIDPAGTRQSAAEILNHITSLLSDLFDFTEYYKDNISSQIIQGRCIACHTTGGIAGSTPLVYVPGSNPLHLALNLATLASYVNGSSQVATRILQKASGQLSHGGGQQLTAGSDDYNNLEAFLEGLIEADETIDGIFGNVALAPPTQTLRRGALLLARRAPTDLESNTVLGAQPEQQNQTLRDTLRNMLQGQGFHDFLMETANDQLLTDKYLWQVILNDYKYPNVANDRYVLRQAAETSGDYSSLQRHNYLLAYGTSRAPLELIAHVARNDLPYTDILTADYMMMNPWSNRAMDGDAVFENPLDPTEFKPGHNRGYYRDDDSKVTEDTEFGLRVTNPGNLSTVYPHAGILNTQAFLRRYPSTATNRNRARSRWTYYHFLGFDIEMSARRTTDPDALADTDNPTLKNPNCAVCHETLDPVAGAFQNYGDEGDYRDKYRGLDSLPYLYKWPEDDISTLYEWGDTWYRDMRLPGFETQAPPSADTSLQWLATQISQDPRFAAATVRFWWTGIMGNKPLSPPDDQQAPDYPSALTAWQSQSAFIENLATRFREGISDRGPYNLKDLLVELILSPWFRADHLLPIVAEGINENTLIRVGVERLLTPEELGTKTEALTGFVWGRAEVGYPGPGRSGLHGQYRLLFGGIDSDGIISRSSELTPVMASVAKSHALESACPIVIREFLLPAEERLLLTQVSAEDTPVSEHSITSAVSGDGFENRGVYPLSGDLSAGSKFATISFENDYWAGEGQDRNLIVDSLIIKRGDNVVLNIELEDIENIEGASAGCGDAQWNPATSSVDHFNIWSNCTLIIPFSADADGTYELQVVAWGDLAGADLPQMRLGFNSSGETGNSVGAERIKRTIVHLHKHLLGEELSIEDPEIARTFALFEQTWSSRREIGDTWLGSIDTCDTWHDFDFYERFIDGYKTINPEYGYVQWDWDKVGEFNDAAGIHQDSSFSKQAWTVVLAYMLSDYKYLYLN